MSDIHQQSRLPPLVRQVPSEPLASPAHLPLAPDHDPSQIQWYKPTYVEALKLMGWRWVYFLPAAGLVLLLIIFAPMRPVIFIQLLAWWKLLVIAIALPMGLAIKSMKKIVAARQEPFCIHCGYDLTGLSDGHNCPECGRPYSLAVINEYRRDPDWFIQRYNQRHMTPRADVPIETGKAGSQRKSRDGT